jgi:hypothetical protein
MGCCWKGVQRVHEEFRTDEEESLRERLRLFLEVLTCSQNSEVGNRDDYEKEGDARIIEKRPVHGRQALLWKWDRAKQ